MLIVFAAYVALGIANIFVTSFGGKTVEGTEQVTAQITISVILYIVAIIIPFAIKKTKPLGWILIGISIATLISAGGFGIVGFAILIASGIAALRYKEKPFGTTEV